MDNHPQQQDPCEDQRGFYPPCCPPEGLDVHPEGTQVLPLAPPPDEEGIGAGLKMVGRDEGAFGRRPSPVQSLYLVFVVRPVEFTDCMGGREIQVHPFLRSLELDAFPEVREGIAVNVKF